MTDPKATLLQLNQNLNILQEREAKFGDNAPLELLNQINDHQQAIDLTRQAITGELDEIAWHESLKPLLLACRDGQVVNIEAETYIAGDQIITYIYESPPPPLPPAEAKERRELGILLNKVKQFWIEGVLEKSVHQMALIDLGKETQAEAVAHAWEQVLELPDQSRQTLPPDKKISRIFDEMNRALLILGEPGSGKTITLLQLAQELITQAETDETFSQPVPVVFNLSSWTNTRQSLIDWLVAELTAKYQIPKRIGRSWLENNRLLPLLDGLDEVRLDNQAACVEAINHFGEEFGLAGLVVCSRLKEYTRLPVRLKLNGAIRLQPLTLEQIYNYLDGAGSKLDAFHTALQTDDGLQDMARSPLMLGIMTLAYQDMPTEDLVSQSLNVEARRKHLFDTYIKRMFKRRGEGDKPYTDKQTKEWLSWLAQQLKQHNQTEFLVERLQPDWLSSSMERQSYLLISRLIIGLIIGAIAGLTFFLSFGVFLGISANSSLLPRLQVSDLLTIGWVAFNDRWMIGLTYGLIGGIIFGLLDIWWLEWRKETKPKNDNLSWRLIIHTVVITLVIAGCFLLQFGLSIGLGETLIVTLTFGGGFASIVILTERRQNPTDDIHTVEALSWSLNQAIKYGGTLGVIPVLIAVAVTLSLGVSWAIRVSAGLAWILFVAIFWGLKGGKVESKTTPNHGVRLSLRNAIYTGIVFGLVIGVIVGVVNILLRPHIFIPPFILLSLIFFFIGGLGAAMWYGGLVVIQHYTLRIILYLQNHTPLNYIHFLDYATGRVFLQKVGGGYIFIHRLLLEHFATLNSQPTPAKNNKVILKWGVSFLFLFVVCFIIIIYLTHTLPQSRNAVHAAILREQGVELAKQGEIEEALISFAKARKLNADPERSAYAWGSLCWYGSLGGDAHIVIDACERAVEIAPGSAFLRDRRGLARALTGDYDGAIQDFRFVVEEFQDDKDWYETFGFKRVFWIETLENKDSPFTNEVLEDLWHESEQ